MLAEVTFGDGTTLDSHVFCSLLFPVASKMYASHGGNRKPNDCNVLLLPAAPCPQCRLRWAMKKRGESPET